MLKITPKQLKNFWQKSKFYWLILLLTLPAIFDLLKPGYFPMHDDLQILRIEQLDRCIMDGQIPCRWIPDAGFGYGYPMFNYYPPLPYYFAEGLHLLGINFFMAIKLTFAASIVLSGMFMFQLAKSFFKNWGGLVASIFYVYAPYHAVDVYVRGAMNEAWGLVWFPLIFYAIYKIIEKPTWRRSALLAVSYAALMMSHNVMTLIFTPLMGVWALFGMIANKGWHAIKYFIVSGLLAIGLAAFFFLPVVFEQNLVHVESMTVGYFNYLAHFADLNQMLFSRFWGFGGSTWGPEDDMAFPIGQLHWGLSFLIGAIMLGLLVNRLLQKKFKSAQTDMFLLTLILLGVTAFYIFLIHPRSVWFWDNFPLLYYAQFPWRLLAIPAFTFSLVAAAFTLFTKKNLWPYISGVLIAAVIFYNMQFFHTARNFDITFAEKYSGNLWELQVTGGIFDYLPKTASRPPGAPYHIYPIFLEGEGGIGSYQKGTKSFSFIVNVSSDNALIQVPHFDYPVWEITDDGEPIEYSHDSDLGRLTMELDKGEHHIEAELKNTPIRLFANYLSVFSLMALGIVIKKKD